MRTWLLGVTVLVAAVQLGALAEAKGHVSDQRPATLIAAAPERGAVTLSGVRWGFSVPRPGRASAESWAPRFKDTTIRTDQVKDVYLLIEPFQPEWLAAHAMLAFKFGKEGAMVGADGKRASALALSVEARLKEGQSYGLIAGMQNKFGIVYQLSTLADIYQKDLLRQQHKLIRYRLQLSPQQKQALLENAIAEATKDRSGEHYHTTRNSCYQNVHRIINTVLPKELQVRDWLFRVPLPGGRSFGIYNPLATWPKAAAFAYRRVIEPGSRVESQPRTGRTAGTLAPTR